MRLPHQQQQSGVAQQDPEETGEQSSQRLWLFIQSLIRQEEDARRLLMLNAMGMDIYMQTLAKLLIVK